MYEFKTQRGCQERRRNEFSFPPDNIERRLQPERRLPEMAALRLSKLDWENYFGTSAKKS